MKSFDYYEKSGLFDYNQLFQISCGFKDGVNPEFFANPDNTFKQMEWIRKLLLKNKDIIKDMGIDAIKGFIKLKSLEGAV